MNVFVYVVLISDLYENLIFFIEVQIIICDKFFNIKYCKYTQKNFNWIFPEKITHVVYIHRLIILKRMLAELDNLVKGKYKIKQIAVSRNVIQPEENGTFNNHFSENSMRTKWCFAEFFFLTCGFCTQITFRLHVITGLFFMIIRLLSIGKTC